MGELYEIRYRLPVAKVRFAATWTHTQDSVLAPKTTQDQLTASSTEMVIAADYRSEFTARIETGALQNVNASLSLTDDQRLTSASGGSDGQAGVIATRPATAPEAAPNIVGFPRKIHSPNIHATAAVAVAT